MLKRMAAAGVIFLGLAGSIIAVTPGEKAASSRGIEPREAFEKLKGLAGDWKAGAKTDHDGHLGKDANKVNFRVTAAGSALIETQFPGSDHEMVSVYHMDGDNLLMTHYCAAQNQPRLKLNKDASTASRLVFDFDGGTNFNPAKDIHIHSAVINLDGKTVKGEWAAYQNGKPFHTEVIELQK